MEGVESKDSSPKLFQIGKARRKKEYDLGLMGNKGEFVKVFSPSQAPKELIFSQILFGKSLPEPPGISLSARKFRRLNKIWIDPSKSFRQETSIHSIAFQEIVFCKFFFLFFF